MFGDVGQDFSSFHLLGHVQPAASKPGRGTESSIPPSSPKRIFPFSHKKRSWTSNKRKLLPSPQKDHPKRGTLITNLEKNKITCPSSKLYQQFFYFQMDSMWKFFWLRGTSGTDDHYYRNVPIIRHQPSRDATFNFWIRMTMTCSLKFLKSGNECSTSLGIFSSWREFVSALGDQWDFINLLIERKWGNKLIYQRYSSTSISCWSWKLLDRHVVIRKRLTISSLNPSIVFFWRCSRVFHWRKLINRIRRERKVPLEEINLIRYKKVRKCWVRFLFFFG